MVLYEIKEKKSLDESKDEIDHIEDTSFQVIVLEEQGIELEIYSLSILIKIMFGLMKLRLINSLFLIM